MDSVFWTNPVRHPEDVGVGNVRRAITFDQSGIGTGVPIGCVPKGATILRAACAVTEVFDAGTTNVLVLGTSADDDGFVTSTNAAAGTTGLKSGTGALLTGAPLTADTVIYAKFTQTGTAATAGAAQFIVEFVNARDE